MEVIAFEWVSNPAKVLRAKKELEKQNEVLKAQGKAPIEITEELIKEQYKKLGGLVIGDPSTQKGVDEDEITLPVIPVKEREAFIEKKKSKKR